MEVRAPVNDPLGRRLALQDVQVEPLSPPERSDSGTMPPDLDRLVFLDRLVVRGREAVSPGSACGPGSAR